MKNDTLLYIFLLLLWGGIKANAEDIKPTPCETVQTAMITATKLRDAVADNNKFDAQFMDMNDTHGLKFTGDPKSSILSWNESCQNKIIGICGEMKKQVMKIRNIAPLESERSEREQNNSTKMTPTEGLWIGFSVTADDFLKLCESFKKLKEKIETNKAEQIGVLQTTRFPIFKTFYKSQKDWADKFFKQYHCITEGTEVKKETPRPPVAVDLKRK